MQAIIEGTLYEIEPAVKVILDRVMTENNELKKANSGLKIENEALKLLVEWAEECDFGYDNFPEEYENYKDEIEDMGYIDGMIYIAKRVCQQKRGAE